MVVSLSAVCRSVSGNDRLINVSTVPPPYGNLTRVSSSISDSTHKRELLTLLDGHLVVNSTSSDGIGGSHSLFQKCDDTIFDVLG